MKTTALKKQTAAQVKLSSVLALGALAALASCSTSKSLRVSDCEPSPVIYGQCAVEAGLPKKHFETLSEYCSSHGAKFDQAAFEQARVAREKELCATPRGVFELQFRASAGVNGPVTCSKDLLTTKEQQRAVEDGKAAAFAYGKKDPNGNELAHSQERRFNADRNGYDVGLNDRTVLIDTRQDVATRDTYRNQFEKIVDGYPGVVEQELLTERRCSANGSF